MKSLAKIAACGWLLLFWAVSSGAKLYLEHQGEPVPATLRTSAELSGMVLCTIGVLLAFKWKPNDEKYDVPEPLFPSVIVSTVKWVAIAFGGMFVYGMLEKGYSVVTLAATAPTAKQVEAAVLPSEMLLEPEILLHSPGQAQFATEARIAFAKRYRELDTLSVYYHYVLIQSSKAATFTQQLNDSLKAGYEVHGEMHTERTGAYTYDFVQLLAKPRH